MVFVLRKRELETGNNFNHQLNTIEEDAEAATAKHLAFKSGFLSIKDRMQSLKEQASHRNEKGGRSSLSNRRHLDNGLGGRPQYATLHEMFASKGGTKCSNNDLRRHEKYCSCDECLKNRRPKIPVMKLSKEDWNVKIWEDRLRWRQGGRAENGQHEIEMNRVEKPKQQVEVFQGRIEEVAQKLDKVREGLPQDEKLFQLTTNRLHETRSSQSWTSLLKEELSKGTHDPKTLKSKFEIKSNKSPLGRPIGKIFQDSMDEDGDEESRAKEIDLKQLKVTKQSNKQLAEMPIADTIVE